MNFIYWCPNACVANCTSCIFGESKSLTRFLQPSPVNSSLQILQCFTFRKYSFQQIGQSNFQTVYYKTFNCNRKVLHRLALSNNDLNLVY
jgi:hypothetical protein